jgi:hypothetical protein
MKTQAARKIVEERVVELEIALSRAVAFTTKRNILQGLQSCREMLLYLDLIEMGREPRFIKICEPIAFPDSEVFA